MRSTVSQDTEMRTTTFNTWLRVHDSDSIAASPTAGSRPASYDPGRSMFSLGQIDYHRVRLGRDEPVFQAWFALDPGSLLVSTCGTGPHPWGRIISSPVKGVRP